MPCLRQKGAVNVQMSPESIWLFTVTDSEYPGDKPELAL
jgi:hypothetical protein